MRPVIRGEAKDKNTDFKKYEEAKPYLIDNIGEYCSYCERRVNNALAVEHIQPKKHCPELELKWNNFLLACFNCNSTKSQKIVNLSDYFWCDRDNTFRAFTYFNGVIEINNQLTQIQQEIARKTIDLTGLDRVPKHPKHKSKDNRWKQRGEAWNIAQDSLKDLKNSDTEELRKCIVRNALAQGFWSIWMTVFGDDKDMLERFIKAFPGTCQDCFDQDFNAVPRPGGAL